MQVEGPLHAVHRLDRATSGVLLVARHAAAAADLGRQLMARSVGKSYLAVVRGWPTGLSFIDMAWGTLVSGVSAAAGAAALRWFMAR